MNILVLNYEFPPIGGGASPVSYDISRKYVEHGHNVHVVTMKFSDLPTDEVVDGITIHRVKCIRKEKFVCHPWEQLSYIISAILYLARYINKNTVDIVHAHFIIPTGVIACYLNKKYRIPYIITAHGSDVPGHNNKRFGLLYKLIMKPWRTIVRQADYIVSPSGYLKDLICKNMLSQNGSFFDDNKVRIIPNGIDTSKYYIAPQKKKLILIMGRLQETKGVQDILNAVDSDFLGEWSIAIVGDGPYRSELERIVNSRGIEKKVKFYGWIDPSSKEKYDILSEASIFMSGSHFENCPVTLMEAYFSGCKLVVSDIRGHREIAQERAEYFKLGNREMIRNSIVHAMSLYSFNEKNTDKSVYDWSDKILIYERLMLE